MTPSGRRRQVLVSGTWMAVSQVLPLLTTAGLSVLAGRVLGAELLGQQSLIAYCAALAAALLVGSLTDASVQALATEAGARGGEPSPALERWVLRTHSSVGAVVGLLLVGTGVLRGELVAAWVLIGVAASLDAVGWAYAARSIAVHGWAAVAKSRLVAQLVSVALAAVALLSGLGIAGIFGASAVASLGLLVVLRRSCRAPAPGSSAGWPRPVVRLWALFAVGEVLTQVVGRRVEFLFLAAYSTSAEIAAFSIAVMAVSAAAAVPGALAGAAMPAVALAHAAGEQELARTSLVRALHVTAVATLLLGALLVAVGPAAVTGLYGAEFSRAADLVPVVALALLLSPSGQLCTTYWSALGRLRLTIVAGLVGGAIDLGLAWALVPDLGAEGAAWASVAGQSTDALVVLVASWHLLERPRLHVRSWGAALVTAGAAGGPARLLADELGGLAGALAGAGCFAVVLTVLTTAATRLRAPVLSAADAGWLVGMLPATAGRVVATVLLPPAGRSRRP